MKSRHCPAGKHDYGATPYRADAGYQQTPDGRRVDGKWLGFRCERCGHTVERWQAEGADLAAAGVNVDGAWAVRDDESDRVSPPASIWERPAFLWSVGLFVVLVLAYAWYWDSRVGREAGPTAVKVKPNVIASPTETR